jgi:glycosyltransferase involved in cell wall biosynthesis
MINYTIIIPHKNIPHLLERCLKSIPVRDDLQIIVVDDDSDNPPRHCDNVEFIYAKDKNRRGAGYARNLGLERAKGKWVTFADADDFYMPCFNEVLDQYKDDNSDIIYFKVTSVDNDTFAPSNRHQGINRYLSEIQTGINTDRLFELYGPIAKFIKREIIEHNKIHFQEVLYSNDVLFSIKCAWYAKHNKISDKEIYCITSRPGSLIQPSLDSYKIRIGVAFDSVMFFKKINKEYIGIKHFDLYWNDIYKFSKISAIRLLPKVYAVHGLKYTLKLIKKILIIKQ